MEYLTSTKKKMKDEYQNESSEPRVITEEEQIALEALAKMAPEGVLVEASEKAHEHVMNTVHKLGHLLGSAGHSAFRASLSHVPNHTNEGSIVGTMLFSISVEGLHEEGFSVDEVRGALAASITAINEYFRTLGPDE